MAYKQKGSPFQRNFGIGSPAKQMLKPRVAPVAAPVNAPVNTPVAPPVDPAMIAQAAKAVKGAMAPPPVDPGAKMPPPMQRNLRMESPVKKAVKGAVGGGMSGIAKAKSAVKNVGGLAKGVSLGGAVKAVKPVVKAATGIAKGAGGLVSKVIKK